MTKAAAERTLELAGIGEEIESIAADGRIRVTESELRDLLTVRDAYLALLNNPAAFAGELAGEPVWTYDDELDRWRLETAVGVYEVWKSVGGGYRWDRDDEEFSDKDAGFDVEAAKAACLLDYHARVASVLRKAPNG